MAHEALNLITNLTYHIIELETRLASHTSIMNDESFIHRQFNDLNELDKYLQSIEKSIRELVIQSKQLDNEKLNHISDQLALRWQQISSEINHRFVFN